MSSFRINDVEGVAYYTSAIMDEMKNIRHFFSSRAGGVSTGAYESLNLGIYSDDSEEHVEENMSRVFKAAGMNWENAVYLRQVHGDTLHVVTRKNHHEIRGIQGDGLITSCLNIPIGIFTADCVPILLLDKNKGIAAALHGGWKGTKLCIVKKAVELMCSQMESSPQDIVAAIGPCIGFCCFEVGKDVAQRFFSSNEREGRLYVDLALENINQLKSCGVPHSSISTANICTFCNTDKLFSYRRDRGITGRMASFIELI